MAIAVLVSGGVDSSVALHLLRQQGHTDLRAYYLKIWLEDELSFLGQCPWEEDLESVRAVCDMIDVPLEVVPLQQAYHDRVVSYTVAELKAGRTPTPDVFCNERIKFGAFLERVGNACERVATGHYAQIIHTPEGSRLYKGNDPVKDQTYFLAHMHQGQLQRCLFPIGAYPKTEVRQLAHEFNLPNRARPDSQGICFLGKIRYNDFVAHHLGKCPGEIREQSTNKKIGMHEGLWFHTIGQRKGLGMSGGPWYVVAKNIDDNVLYVAHADEKHKAETFMFAIPRVNWLHLPPARHNLQVRIRHGERIADCTVEGALATGPLTVHLSEGDSGIATGQMAVLYDGDECLGGGLIDSAST